MNPDPSCTLQPANLRTPESEPAALSSASQCVQGGRGSSIISEPSSKRDGIPWVPASTMAPPGVPPMTLEDLLTSPSHVYDGASFSWTHANDQACFSLMDPDRTYNLEGLEKMDFLTLASQGKTVNPMKGNLIMLFDDFYYG